jgi:hypothetical protein
VLQLKSELARVRREEVFLFCAGLIELGAAGSPSPEADETRSLFAIGSIMQLLTYRIQTGTTRDGAGDDVFGGTCLQRR